IAGQVDQFLSQNGPFNSKDLIAVMVGLHDVQAQYNRLQNEPGVSRDVLIAGVQQAGNELGAQVVRLTNLGAKVVVSTIYSLSLSPFATGEELAHPGDGRATLLDQLTTEYNKALRLKLNEVADGGHSVGLIQSDELVLSMVRYPPNYVLNNVTEAACNVALPDCNQTTLVPLAIDSYGAYWLWADDTRLGAAGQSRVAGLAVNRVRTNPF
ncbi:MAG TPA: hypothetical protein VFL64_16175, partial [Rhizobacter sp.]|nr:hypothetical protein [Rhizobacter sp.]